MIVATKNMIKAVGYARRSTDMQERSIPDQQAYIERWANEHGYHVLRWFVDDAISATSVKGRTDFERMIREAEAGSDFKAIICYDISRFSRGGTNETGYYLHRLKLAGIEAVFPAEGIPEGDEGELLQGVKSWQARQYSVKLSRDCIRGMVSAVKVKRSAPGGRAPYGFDKQFLTPAGQVLRTIRYLPDGRKQEFDARGRHVRFIAGDEGVGKVKSDIVRYVPGDKQHVKVVRRMFDMCAQGYGFRSIALALNDDGIPSPTGGPWNVRGVKLILNNPAYRGALCFNKTTQGKIHGITSDGRAYAKRGATGTALNGRDRWIVVEDVHEPLVTKEVFEKAQAEMTRRRDAKGKARPTRRYLLSGLLKCNHCGLNLWGAELKLYAKGIRRGYYVDAGYRRFGPKTCKSTSIQAEALDRWVLGKVRQVILNDAEGTKAAVDAFVRTVVSQQKGGGVDRSAIDKELAAVNRRIQTTVAMLADPDLSDLGELKATLVDLKRQREVLEARKEDASKAKRPTLDQAALRQWANEKLDRLGDAVNGRLSPLETRQLVHAYIDRIELDPYEYTGTMFIVPDALALLEAESTRRVNVGSNISTNAPKALCPSARVGAIQMACSISLALGCTRLCILSSTLAVLCTQQRCSRVVGYTCRRAFQKPNAPSPTASFGSMVNPRCLQSSRSCNHDCSLSRYPSVRAISSFLPSGVAPIRTRMH